MGGDGTVGTGSEMKSISFAIVVLAGAILVASSVQRKGVDYGGYKLAIGLIVVVVGLLVWSAAMRKTDQQHK
jgi:hypothetical protein